MVHTVEVLKIRQEVKQYTQELPRTVRIAGEEYSPSHSCRHGTKERAQFTSRQTEQMVMNG